MAVGLLTFFIAMARLGHNVFHIIGMELLGNNVCLIIGMELLGNKLKLKSVPHQTLFPIIETGSKLLEYDILIDGDMCTISVVVTFLPSF